MAKSSTNLTRVQAAFVLLALSAAYACAGQGAGATGLTPVPAETGLKAAPLAVSPLSEQPASTGLRPAPVHSDVQKQLTPQTGLRPVSMEPAKLERTEQLQQELQAVQTPKAGLVFELPSDVLFDFDQAQLRADATPVIDKARELIQSYENVMVTVHGHTDSKGSDEYNMDLSKRRAETVADALKGASQYRIEAVAHGETKPVADNEHPDGSDNPQGRQKNRRVQIELHEGDR